MANSDDWKEEIPQTISAALAAIERIVSSESFTDGDKLTPKRIESLTKVVATLSKIEKDHAQPKNQRKVNVNL